MYDCSGEPVVHSIEPGLPRTDVSLSGFEVGAPTSKEEVKKKSRSLQRVLSRLYLMVSCSLFYIACFFSDQWLLFSLFAGDAEAIPGVPGNEDSSTGVETDGQLRRCHIVVTRSLRPLAGGPRHDVPEAFHSRGRNRELLEQAFDDGFICVQMRNLTILFHVNSKFLPHLCLLDHCVTDPAATVIRATDHQMFVLVSLRLRGGESQIAASIDE